MTPEQIELCRSSWAKVEPIAEDAAGIFYTSLFEADPSLKPLFKGDMKAQGEKLMQMIGAAVSLLDKPEVLIPTVQKLGVRHAGYGVEDSHYATVGGALIKTLGLGLGDAFTDDVKEAWVAAYTILSNTMIDASKAA